MIILDHFAAYTRLPIKIDQIADFIKDRGYVDKIIFHPLDEDPAVLAGMLLHRKNLAPYASGEIADIVYSTQLEHDIQRLVAAKELLHICDVEGACAKTKEQVLALVDEILIPLNALTELAAVSPQLVSDHGGILLAVALLIPRDAREELKAMLDAGVMNVTQIAALVEVPESFVRLAMRDDWGKILDSICPN